MTFAIVTKLRSDHQRSSLFGLTWPTRLAGDLYHFLGHYQYLQMPLHKVSIPFPDKKRSSPPCIRCCFTTISTLLIPILHKRPPGKLLDINLHITQSDEALILIVFAQFNTKP